MGGRQCSAGQNLLPEERRTARDQPVEYIHLRLLPARPPLGLFPFMCIVVAIVIRFHIELVHSVQGVATRTSSLRRFGME
jgi:hypothetical protein